MTDERLVFFVELTHGTKGIIYRKDPPAEGGKATVKTEDGVFICGTIRHMWASDHELEEARVF